MTPAVAYMRCSGKGQIDGDTWDRQEAAIQKYAATHDIEIVAWFRDEGLTGKMELENRPGLAACLERVENNGVHLVLVESADRLARDSMIAELIIRQFQKAKAQVISASGGVDLTAGDDSNPTAKLIRQVLAAVAEFDRCVTVLKLKAARDRIKKNGRLPSSRRFSTDPILNKCVEGPKPYGFQPGEEAILKTIHTLQIEGFNAPSIAKELNQRLIPSRHGLPWRSVTISRILSRLKA